VQISNLALRERRGIFGRNQEKSYGMLPLGGFFYVFTLSVYEIHVVYLDYLGF